MANRALVSAVLAFLGGSAAMLLPFPPVVSVPFLLIGVAVAISAIRTLNHPEASVIGGARHLGIVLAALGGVAGAIGLALRALLLFHG